MKQQGVSEKQQQQPQQQQSQQSQQPQQPQQPSGYEYDEQINYQIDQQLNFMFGQPGLVFTEREPSLLYVLDRQSHLALRTRLVQVSW